MKSLLEMFLPQKSGESDKDFYSRQCDLDVQINFMLIADGPHATVAGDLVRARIDEILDKRERIQKGTEPPNCDGLFDPPARIRLALRCVTFTEAARLFQNGQEWWDIAPEQTRNKAKNMVWIEKLKPHPVLST
jgi:hypothetical protein